MHKTTVYLPEDLDAQLSAEARATGVSKAQLLREAVRTMLAASTRSRGKTDLPVFRSGGSLTVDEMDDAMLASMQERAARR